MMVFGDELLLVGIKQMSWWIFYKVNLYIHDISGNCNVWKHFICINFNV